MILFCCASELGPPEDLSAIEVILYYYYYVTRELAAVRQSRCVSNKMIAAMREQIRTLDYRSGQHYMTVCVPNKYLVARTGQ